MQLSNSHIYQNHCKVNVNLTLNHINYEMFILMCKLIVVMIAIGVNLTSAPLFMCQLITSHYCCDITQIGSNIEM